MTHGEVLSEDTLNYLRQLVAFDRQRTHERKNESSARQVRDSLSERMRLAESAEEWLKEL